SVPTPTATPERSTSRPRAAAASGVATDTTAGRWAATWAASRSTLEPADSPVTRSRSGKASTIRSTLVPTDPVEPRMDRPLLMRSRNVNGPGKAGPSSAYQAEVIVQNGRSEQQPVQPVEHAPVAGEQPSRVLHPRPALEQGLAEVSRRPHHGHDEPQRHGMGHGHLGQAEELDGQGADDASEEAGPGAFPRLARRDGGRQLAPAQRAAREVGRAVGHHHDA